MREHLDSQLKDRQKFKDTINEEKQKEIMYYKSEEEKLTKEKLNEAEKQKNIKKKYKQVLENQMCDNFVRKEPEKPKHFLTEENYNYKFAEEELI